MTQAKRGRQARRGFYLCAIAALGLVLTGCGGSAGSSSADASAADNSAPAQSSAPGQSTSVGSSTAAAPASSGSGHSTGTGSTHSGSTGAELTGGTSSSSGAITLNWIPPTENIDGTALTNLAGYNMHYGKGSHQYTQKIAVSNPGIATYVLQDLTPGKYYFSVAAVNSHGTESPLSAEVSASVN